jgi:hypothetical protein
MKWGTLFPADYVNVLYRAVTAHLKPGFKFVCLTDRTEGLDSGISTAPIPDIGLTPAQVKAPGVWRKLALFHPDVAALGTGARALFIDLDMMILGPMDEFFSQREGLIAQDMGEGWRPRPRRDATTEPGTCVFAFTLGEQQHILQAFQADISGAMSRFQNEQDFVAAHAAGLSLWPSGMVISFKRHLVHRFGIDLLVPPRPPEPGPAILAFHGDPRPSDLLRAGIWGRFPHVGWGPVRWVNEYWRRWRDQATDSNRVS